MGSPRDLAFLLDPRPVRTGRGWMVRCPAHEDTDPSLHVSERQDGRGCVLYCFAGCEWQAVHDAIRRAGHGRFLPPRRAPGAPLRPQGPGGPFPQHPRGSWAGPAAGIPSRAELVHPDHGPPTGLWPYGDPQGRIHAVVARYSTGAGRKSYRPWSWWAFGSPPNARTVLIRRMPPRPRPMYRLFHLVRSPGRAVVLVEGEKCAEAAALLMPDLPATTVMGGAGSASHADLSPLSGRTVALVPDEDEAGRRHARKAMELLRAAGARPVLCPLSGSLPRAAGEGRGRGWDLADAVSAGLSREAVAAWRRSLPKVHVLHLEAGEASHAQLEAGPLPDAQPHQPQRNHQEGAWNP